MNKTEYIITIEYTERTEYLVRLDEDGFPEAGDIYDNFEQDPVYLVHEITKDENGNIIYKSGANCLKQFITYEEATQFIKEQENNMLEDNIQISREKGEYKDFPNKYAVYLYGKRVWEDDFNEELSDKKVIEEFIKDLQYIANGLGE